MEPLHHLRWNGIFETKVSFTLKLAQAALYSAFLGVHAPKLMEKFYFSQNFAVFFPFNEEKMYDIIAEISFSSLSFDIILLK